MIASGGNVHAVLEELGFDSVRIRDSLLRSAGAGDLNKSGVGTGTQGFTAGRSIPLTNKEYRLLYELSVNARVVPHDHLLQALWGPGHPGHPGPVRTVVKNLRRKLGEGAHNPTYILNEPRIGYRMPRAGTAV